RLRRSPPPETPPRRRCGSRNACADPPREERSFRFWLGLRLDHRFYTTAGSGRRGAFRGAHGKELGTLVEEDVFAVHHVLVARHARPLEQLAALVAVVDLASQRHGLWREAFHISLT